MFKTGEELKVISVDLPTTGLHALLVEQKIEADGTTLLILRAGGTRPSSAKRKRKKSKEKS